MLLESLPNLTQWISSTRRRNLKVYNVYRLAIATIILLSQMPAFQEKFGATIPLFVLKTFIAYFIFSAISAVFSWSKRKPLALSVPLQILIDIAFMILMMHFFRQNQTGVGLLLIITIVFAGLISEGRYALFYAAIASIGVLLEQTYSINNLPAVSNNYTNAVLLSLSCFATSWLAHTLAKRMELSERLALEQDIDIANLAKINALITQEMPNGVLVIGEDQQIKHYNQQLTQLTGLSDEALSKVVAEKGYLHTLAPTLSTLMFNWSQEEDTKLTEAIKLTVNNRDFGIRFIPISDRRSDGAVIFIEDWSQVQTQAHQVKLAALGRLTANIAHEIRNPLSAISHANQLLQEDNTDPTTLRMLQIIGDNVQRLDQIIKDVLELNRRDRTNQESIQLNHFIQDFYHQFCAVEKINPSDFKVNPIDEDIVIFFDRRHINQILWNLCKNGWRHCKKNAGSLTLSSQSNVNSPYIDIVIQDDGDGIAESIQSNLFEPFMTTEKTGTGLGLYIARELAEANGGKLNFKTSSAGTQFTLNLKKV